LIESILFNEVLSPLLALLIGLLIKLLDNGISLGLFFLNQSPDQLILERHNVMIGLVGLNKELSFSNLSWQIIRIHVYTGFDRLRYKIFGLLLQIFDSEQERNHAFGIILSRERLRIHAC
jgi:hypothetical protein